MTLAAAATACGAGAEATNNQNATTPAAAQVETPRSRAAFEEALAAYDAGEIAAAEVDRLAAQKYATVSRLYWHTDIDDAIDEARERGLPILSLRMLGRLDEDYSCANSRFFRVALYANAEVSRLLRDSFVLHWSPEREVPKITIDYGDGRVVRRTIAGNSAHYVLDERGRPIDVLPGLYGPQAFVEGLREAAGLAETLRGASDADRRAALVSYHDRRWKQNASRASRLAASIPGATILAAEQFAVGKAATETPLIRSIDLDPAVIAGNFPMLRLQAERMAVAARLDDRSRALIARLEPYDWSGNRAADLDALIAGFERLMSIDTAVNEYVLRPLISKRFVDQASADLGFDALNDWIYATLFRTPASDPWLGMSAAGTFTALPSSGVSLAPRR